MKEKNLILVISMSGPAVPPRAGKCGNTGLGSRSTRRSGPEERARSAVQGRPRPEEARGTGYGLVRRYPACGRPEATIPAERPPFAARGDGRPLKLTDARRAACRGLPVLPIQTAMIIERRGARHAGAALPSRSRSPDDEKAGRQKGATLTAAGTGLARPAPTWNTTWVRYGRPYAVYVPRYGVTAAYGPGAPGPVRTGTSSWRRACLSAKPERAPRVFGRTSSGIKNSSIYQTICQVLPVFRTTLVLEIRMQK